MKILNTMSHNLLLLCVGMTIICPKGNASSDDEPVVFNRRKVTGQNGIDTGGKANGSPKEKSDAKFASMIADNERFYDEQLSMPKGPNYLSLRKQTSEDKFYLDIVKNKELDARYEKRDLSERRKDIDDDKTEEIRKKVKLNDGEHKEEKTKVQPKGVLTEVISRKTRSSADSELVQEELKKPSKKEKGAVNFFPDKASLDCYLSNTKACAEFHLFAMTGYKKMYEDGLYNQHLANNLTNVLTKTKGELKVTLLELKEARQKIAAYEKIIDLYKNQQQVLMIEKAEKEELSRIPGWLKPADDSFTDGEFKYDIYKIEEPIEALCSNFESLKFLLKDDSKAKEIWRSGPKKDELSVIKGSIMKIIEQNLYDKFEDLKGEKNYLWELCKDPANEWSESFFIGKDASLEEVREYLNKVQKEADFWIPTHLITVATYIGRQTNPSIPLLMVSELDKGLECLLDPHGLKFIDDFAIDSAKEPKKYLRVVYRGERARKYFVGIN